MSTLVHEIPEVIRDILAADSDMAIVNGWLIDAYPYPDNQRYPLVEIITQSEVEKNLQTGSRTLALSGYIRVTCISTGQIQWNEATKYGTVVKSVEHKEILFNIARILNTNANKHLSYPTLTSGVVDTFKTGEILFDEQAVQDGMIYQGIITWDCDVTENRT